MDLELPRDFKELFELLNANDVEYLMIGGYAVGVYGYSRSTNDLDIFVSDDRENVRRISTALQQFGFDTQALSDLFLEKRSMLELGVEPMKVQLMNFADGLDFAESYASRNVVQVEDIHINTICRSDLVKNKAASGRHKDLADIERLEKLGRE
ncbi:MAG: hypothetical protein QUS14_03915 [Pyrinomonadaceae bacterium]|nr:hypothetical protein [Pyrinomonadaceae bacterium]